MTVDSSLVMRDGLPEWRFAMLSREAIGVALVFCGLPLAWIARYATGGGDSRTFSLGVLVIGLLLVVNWRVLLRGRLHGNPTLLAPPILFLITAMIFSALSANASLYETGYMAFSLAFLLCCLTPDLSRFAGLPAALVSVAMLVSFGTLIQWIYMPVIPVSPEDGTSRLYAGDSNNPNFMAFVAGAGLMGAAWEAAVERRALRWCLYVGSGAFCAAMLILAGTRSALLGLVLCLLVVVTSKILRGLVLRRRRRVAKSGWRLVLAFRLLTAAAVTAFVVPDAALEVLSEKATEVVERTGVGIEGLVSETGSFEESADTRRDLRQEAMEGLSFFGQGYGALYVDFPLLHAYYELGVIPGTLFFIAALALPLALCLRAWYGARMESLPMFVALLYLFFLPNIGVHGKPYDFSVWIPVLMVYAVMGRNGVWR